MRADFLTAYAAVDWAEAQIPILQERFVTWQRRRPYELVVESDPHDVYRELIVARLRDMLDPLIHGDVGAIINSTKTALDLAMSAVLVANGKVPNRKSHFPISRSIDDFQRRLAMFKREQWISAVEAKALEQIKAYDGGDTTLFPLNELDNMRKHERLLRTEPVISHANIIAWGPDIETGVHYSDDKTILFRVAKSRRFRPSEGNTLLTAEIFLNEPTVWVAQKPAITVLRAFISRVKELLRAFP